MLKDGLYEQLINKSLAAELSSIDKSKVSITTAPIDKAEASDILSKYISSIVQKHLETLKDSISDEEELLNKQVEEVNKITALLSLENGLSIPQNAEQLQALFKKQNSILSLNEKAAIIRPETSIAHSSLFTGAVAEPQMFSELKKEILSCNQIDMLVSFVKWSGLRLLIDELRHFTMNGGKLRVITTSYMGATDVRAVEELSKLPNTEVKISYDTTRTRLHAKAYIFYRETGFKTAYVGSSNISNAALSSGLEWNLKITEKDLPKTMQKIDASFAAYWNSVDFEVYHEFDKQRLSDALNAEKTIGRPATNYFSFEIRPFSYQQEILDNLKTEREVRGHYRNLVIAATGTGKTVISALDYRRFKKEHPQSLARILFVAHREEILEQSVCTFRAVLKDQNFGDLLVGSHHAQSVDHLFISIQTFNSKNFWEKTSPDFYDFIIVDEFHHAAAPTYQKLLNYYRPEILLGLTATPERMDGKSILEYFDGRIAAEIRLPEAIDRKLLCPFQYFGVTDSVDLSELKWSKGGYDKNELSNIYTINSVVAQKRVEQIINSVYKYEADISLVKGLGFCVSVEHAKFMSDAFNKHGISSIYLTGDCDDVSRDSAKAKLQAGSIRFIFVVDIYNEGVDIPEINTVLFLRPTESLTIFLQQLGRGLRLSEGKDCLMVLDFIGQANKKYNFEEKFNALLSNTRKGVIHEIKNGFVSAPKGCYIQLEKKATEYILKNVKAACGNQNAIVEKIKTFGEDSELELSLKNFIDFYHLNPVQIYKRESFSRLCVFAGVKNDFKNPNEDVLSKSFVRWLSVDSRNFIKFVICILKNGIKPLASYSDKEKRMLQMMHFTIWCKSAEECGFKSVEESIQQILKNRELCDELVELMNYNYEHIDFVDAPLNLTFDCPLDLYCTYSRDQILVACDFMKPNTVREGVKYLKNKNLDIFFVTLNKSEKDYSDTTLYDDYSINEELFHWQSQSTTTNNSETGKRYISGLNENGFASQALLFVRENKKDPLTGLTSAYTCLGKVKCESYTGSAPISIIWKMENPIPAKYLKKTNKLMVG